MASSAAGTVVTVQGAIGIALDRSCGQIRSSTLPDHRIENNSVPLPEEYRQKLKTVNYAKLPRQE
jgi:hypothetical protein